MRFAVISDVHANLEALDRVLEETGREGIETILFLGDIVGYGPDPNKCLELIKERAEINIAGNHDRAAVDLADSRFFNPYAKAAIKWTHEVLIDENRRYISSLPLIQEVHNDILLVHATPREPEKWHYLMTTVDALLNFEFFRNKICFIGHSHVPVIIELTAAGKIVYHSEQVDIREGSRYLVNAGSVGQPRDRNPDAAYAVLHDNTIEIKRVSYDIVSTKKKMRDTGLPRFLIERLSRGI
jgi:predicted phosphodiesterase